MDNLDRELITAYGTQIKEDIEVIKEKIAAVVTAHLYAGNVGDNPLCQLNRLLGKIRH